MYHAPFLKLTSQERRNGRMVDVDSVWVCRCGERFSSDRQLKSHIYDPFAPGQDYPRVASSQLPELAA